MSTNSATSTDQYVLERIASLVHSFDLSKITPEAINLARTAIIDTIGVTLAGVVEPCSTNLLRTPGVATAPGTCTIFGTNQKTSALDATFINATASHALDYDDFSQPMGGHQSAPLVAPLMALAEERGLSGKKLIEAYIVGIETEIRIARAVNFYHYDKGWHPTATLGVFGAAAAAGFMLELNEKQLAIAMAIAASFASGIKANFGTMVKPLHVGQSARNGLLAALMAQAGYDANPAAMEHKQGFFNAFNGPGNFDASLIFADWANPLEILSPSMGLKQFPCCGSTHPAIAMALKLRQEESIDLETIASIDILPHRRRLPHTNNPDPQTPLAAKFSVQYAVARALVQGAVRLDDFEGEAHFDAKVREVMAKTKAQPHPDMPDDSPDQFGAEVIITMKDGKKMARRINSLVGRGGDYPLTSEELWEKFYDCAKRVLPKQDVPPLFERLESLEKVENVQQITRLLVKRTLPGAQQTPQYKIDTSVGEERAAPGNNTQTETSWVP
jgi:2-methylcitrate dehydratase PrpD